MTPTTTIRRLSKEVVDRIAAGEVVQRPSSALKEVVETCIDAGATQIDVLVHHGGLSLLQITDNGSGIDMMDMPLLCERFATSKLRTFDDLQEMATFGFRGEALASISFVSKLTVITKTAGSRFAVKGVFHDGKLVGHNYDPVTGNPSSVSGNATMIKGVQPVAGNTGTVLVVRDLFHNVPGRKNALMTRKAEEYGRVVEVVTRFAMQYPHVGFTLRRIPDKVPPASTTTSTTNNTTSIDTSTSRTEFSFPTSSTALANIRTVFGSQLAQSLAPFSFTTGENVVASTTTSSHQEQQQHPEPATSSSSSTTTTSTTTIPPSASTAGAIISGSGFASTVSLDQHKRQTLILFINNRLIENAAIKKTIEQCYGPYLVNGNKPFVFLSLTVPPQRVDVNVHPTKSEVFLLDADAICRQFYLCLSGVVGGGGAGSDEATKTTNNGGEASTTSPSGGGFFEGNVIGGVINRGISSNTPQPVASIKTLSPDILKMNLKPVASGANVQIAPSTIARSVTQRGDLVRMFEKIKSEQQENQSSSIKSEILDEEVGPRTTATTTQSSSSSSSSSYLLEQTTQERLRHLTAIKESTGKDTLQREHQMMHSHGIDSSLPIPNRTMLGDNTLQQSNSSFARDAAEEELQHDIRVDSIIDLRSKKNTPSSTVGGDCGGGGEKYSVKSEQVDSDAPTSSIPLGVKRHREDDDDQNEQNNRNMSTSPKVKVEVLPTSSHNGSILPLKQRDSKGGIEERRSLADNDNDTSDTDSLGNYYLARSPPGSSSFTEEENMVPTTTTAATGLLLSGVASPSNTPQSTTTFAPPPPLPQQPSVFTCAAVDDEDDDDVRPLFPAKAVLSMTTAEDDDSEDDGIPNMGMQVPPTGEHTNTPSSSSSSVPSGFLKFQQTLHREQQPSSLSSTHTLVTAKRNSTTAEPAPPLQVPLEQQEVVTARKSSTVAPPPPIPLLQSVLDRLDEIETESTAQSVHFFRKFAFVGGMVTPETFLAQSGTALLLVRWRALVYHVVAQRVFTKWQRHPIVAFTAGTAPSVSKMLRYALVSSLKATSTRRRRRQPSHQQQHSQHQGPSDTTKASGAVGGADDTEVDDDNVVSPHAREEAITSMMHHLHEWRHMIADYFGVVFKTALEISQENGEEEEPSYRHHQQGQLGNTTNNINKEEEDGAAEGTDRFKELMANSANTATTTTTSIKQEDFSNEQRHQLNHRDTRADFHRDPAKFSRSRMSIPPPQQHHPSTTQAMLDDSDDYNERGMMMFVEPTQMLMPVRGDDDEDAMETAVNMTPTSMSAPPPVHTINSAAVGGLSSMVVESPAPKAPPVPCAVTSSSVTNDDPNPVTDPVDFSASFTLSEATPTRQQHHQQQPSSSQVELTPTTTYIRRRSTTSSSSSVAVAPTTASNNINRTHPTSSTSAPDDLYLVSLPDLLHGASWPVPQYSLPDFLLTLCGSAIPHHCFVKKSEYEEPISSSAAAVGVKMEKLTSALSKKTTNKKDDPKKSSTPNSSSTPSSPAFWQVQPPYVDFEDELKCFSGIADALGRSYAQDGCLKIDENEKRILTALQGSLLPSVTSEVGFAGPIRALSDGTAHLVVTVEDLFKVFERC